MNDSTGRRRGLAWLLHAPPACWLAEYRATWLGGDVVAGVTLAAYAIPVSLAYAGLAGLPPHGQVFPLGHLRQVLFHFVMILRRAGAAGEASTLQRGNTIVG